MRLMYCFRPEDASQKGLNIALYIINWYQICPTYWSDDKPVTY